MMRQTPPFRADMVGSLLRTPALKEARAQHAAGTIDAAALAAVEDAEPGAPNVVSLDHFRKK